ncbi:MAG TPA: Do family serine endopeptidase [Spirochaetia bacterium]|nr:Do family serine endopeptidase [Spirochaetia bacterium]
MRARYMAYCLVMLLLAAPNLASAQVPDALAAMQSSFRQVAAKVLPEVVEIDVSEVIRQRQPQLELPFDWFFGQPNNPGGKEKSFRQFGLGSGIIVRRVANIVYVLTNDHVVKDATDISVKLADGSIYKASVVGMDSRKDLALVSFETRDPVSIADLGDSDSLEVGDLVFAVGNPLGFASTVTLGIVSALGRQGRGEVATYTDYIQTDAAINQGNSGGALVNIRGEVVGMNTWIAAPSGGNVGLGFAIPINNARQAIEDFIAKGRVEYGWLGVQIGDIKNSGPILVTARDLKVEGSKGAFIWNLYRGSPADKAGLLPGDFVTRVNGKNIRDAGDLTQLIGGLHAGESYEFAVMRYGSPLTVQVTIGKRDDQDQVAQPKNLWPGLTALPLTDEVRQDQNIPSGVRGVIVGDLADESAPAAVAGIRTGDVIKAIDGKSVGNMMDYYKALNQGSRRGVSLQIRRGSGDVTIKLSP